MTSFIRTCGILCVVFAFISAGLFHVRADETWTKHTIGKNFDYATGVFAYDIDGDEDLDVVAASAYDGDVAWYRAPAVPTKSWTKYLVDDNLGYAWDVFVSDLNNDNKPDIIASGANDNSIIWYQPTASLTKLWTKHVIDDSLSGARSVAVCDIDGDTHPDIVATGSGNGQVVWYEAPDVLTQPWTKYIIDSDLEGAWGIYVYDINDDGNPDIAATGSSANKVVWYEAPGDATQSWTKHVIDSSLHGAAGVFVCDVNGDEDPDIVASGSDANDIVWYEAPDNPAADSWAKYSINTNLNRAVDISVADINGDGRQDCIAIGRIADSVVWFENPAYTKQLWTKHTIDSTLNGPLFLYAADIDRDSSTDIIVSSSRTDEVVWYLNPIEPVIDVPGKPVNQSPSNGNRVASIEPALEASAFSAAEDQTHAASWWQVTDTSGNYSNPVFNSHEDTVNLTQIAVPRETLDYGTTYYWRVKYMDNLDNWSEWSTETSFTTCSVVIRLVPSSTSVFNGDSFTVDIQVEAGGQSVSAVDAYVKFDPAYLQGTNIVHNTEKLANITGAKINNQDGRVEYNAFTSPIQPCPTGTFTVATVTFKSLQEKDDTELYFLNEQYLETAVFNQQVSILSDTVGCTIDLVYDTPLELQTESTTAVEGQKFTITLQVNTGAGQAVSAVDAYLNFDPAYLELIDITPNTANFGQTTGKTIDNGNGRATLQVATNAGRPCPSGNFTAGTLTFRAKEAITETGITLSLSPDRRSAVISEGEAIFGNHADATLKIVEGTKLTGYISLQGSKRPPWGFRIPLTLKMFDSTTTLNSTNLTTVVPEYVFSSRNQDITITEIDPDNRQVTFESYAPLGTFHLALSSPQSITSIVNTYEVEHEGQTVNIGTLAYGDLNGDDEVTEDDLAIFVKDYLQAPGSTDWNDGRSDFDRDDLVTCIDFSLMSANFTGSSE